MHPQTAHSRFLLVAFLLLFQQTPLQAISPSARRVETTFIFVLASQPLSDQQPNECPSTVNHKVIDRYEGLNLTDPSDILDGIVWKDLVVGGVTCLNTIESEASTYFVDQTPSPPDTPADKANPWFLIGTDNSARRCGPFAPRYPARYFFTDDMPRFKQRFIDTNIFPSNTQLPDPIANPIRGDIFMLSQQFAPDDGVVSQIVCTYQAATPAPTPEPTIVPLTDDGGSVCFPAHATVKDQHGRLIPMQYLRLGDHIQVTSSGTLSPVISFSHRQDNIFTSVTVLHIFGGPSQLHSNLTTFSASSSHLLRLPGGSLSPVGRVRRGDSVMLSGGYIGRVERISSKRAKGLYSPVTAHGDILVDGVVASCYTTSLRAEAAHAFVAPIRALFSAVTGAGMSGPEWCSVIDLLRWALR